MRLIDADPLKEKAFFHEIDNVSYVEEEDIDNAPTVDAVERKRGRWIQSDMDDGFVTCSYCKEHRLDGRKALRPDYAAELNYCQNCGAEMQKGEEE